MKKIFKDLLSWIKMKIFYQNEFDGNFKISKNVLIEGTTLKGNIEVMEGCKLHFVSISGNVKIGRFSTLWGPNINLNGQLEIGSFCSIGANVTMQEYNHFTDRLSTYYVFKNFFNETMQETTTNGSIKIGSDVWIGVNSTILSGVKIGNGSIIGANSLVNKDVLDYSIVAGNPARMVKMRFSDEMIKALNQLRWWDWPIEKIQKNSFLFEGVLTMEALQKVDGTE